MDLTFVEWLQVSRNGVFTILAIAVVGGIAVWKASRNKEGFDRSPLKKVVIISAGLLCLVFGAFFMSPGWNRTSEIPSNFRGSFFWLFEQKETAQIDAYDVLRFRATEAGSGSGNGWYRPDLIMRGRGAKELIWVKGISASSLRLNDTSGLYELRSGRLSDWWRVTAGIDWDDEPVLLYSRQSQIKK